MQKLIYTIVLYFKLKHIWILSVSYVKLSVCLKWVRIGNKDIVLYCIVLYCIVLYCIVLYCIVLYCIVYCHNITIFLTLYIKVPSKLKEMRWICLYNWLPFLFQNFVKFSKTIQLESGSFRPDYLFALESESIPPT
jgi:hypothetical protein